MFFQLQNFQDCQWSRFLHRCAEYRERECEWFLSLFVLVMMTENKSLGSDIRDDSPHILSMWESQAASWMCGEDLRTSFSPMASPRFIIIITTTKMVASVCRHSLRWLPTTKTYEQVVNKQSWHKLITCVKTAYLKLVTERKWDANT
jgi:hypothetical protein